ncbi:Imm8 family immunity protein [Variovorax paradoxus]|uniref:Imm8 family immunity protein n=1 Tax=Variovorax paradoxus TaxID=34073 RepID=UPI001ABD2D4D
MRKANKHRLVLREMSSTMTDPLDQWRPRTLEDTYTAVDLDIAMSDGEAGSNLFYVKVATPEALRRRAKGFLIAGHRVLVIEKFDHEQLRLAIEDILEKCTRDTWEASCAALQRYFAWEYEDFAHEG